MTDFQAMNVQDENFAMEERSTTIAEQIRLLKKLLCQSKYLLGLKSEQPWKASGKIHPFSRLDVLDHAFLFTYSILEIARILRAFQKWLKRSSDDKSETRVSIQIQRLLTFLEKQRDMEKSLRRLTSTVMTCQAQAMAYLSERGGGSQKWTKLIEKGVEGGPKSLQSMFPSSEDSVNTLIKNLVHRIRLLVESTLEQANVYYDPISDNDSCHKITISAPAFLVYISLSEDSEVLFASIEDISFQNMPQVSSWATVLLKAREFTLFQRLLRCMDQIRFQPLCRLERLIQRLRNESERLEMGTDATDDGLDAKKLLNFLPNTIIPLGDMDKELNTNALLTCVEQDLQWISAQEIKIGISWEERLWARLGWVIPSPYGPVVMFYIDPILISKIRYKNQKNAPETEIDEHISSSNDDMDIINARSSPFNPSIDLCPSLNSVLHSSSPFPESPFTLDSTPIRLLQQLCQDREYDWLGPHDPHPLTPYDSRPYREPSSLTVNSESVDPFVLFKPASFRVGLSLGPIPYNVLSNPQDTYISHIDLSTDVHTPASGIPPASILENFNSRVTWKHLDTLPSGPFFKNPSLNFSLQLAQPIPVHAAFLQQCLIIASSPSSLAESLARNFPDDVYPTPTSDLFKNWSSSMFAHQTVTFDQLLHPPWAHVPHHTHTIHLNFSRIHTQQYIFIHTSPTHIIIHYLPFVHPAQLQPLVWLLRQQLVFNALYLSCHDKQALPSFFRFSASSSFTRTAKRAYSELESPATTCDKPDLLVEISSLSHPQFGWLLILSVNPSISPRTIFSLTLNVRLNGLIQVQLEDNRPQDVGTLTFPKQLLSQNLTLLQKYLNSTHHLPLSLAKWVLSPPFQSILQLPL